MTLRTVTFDDTKFKIVPREATSTMIDAAWHGDSVHWGNDYRSIGDVSIAYKDMVKAAPDYQEPTKDE